MRRLCEEATSYPPVAVEQYQQIRTPQTNAEKAALCQIPSSIAQPSVSGCPTE